MVLQITFSFSLALPKNLTPMSVRWRTKGKEKEENGV